MASFLPGRILDNYFWFGSLVLALVGWIVSLGALAASQAQYDALPAGVRLAAELNIYGADLGFSWWALWMGLGGLIALTLILMYYNSPSEPSAMQNYRLMLVGLAAVMLAYLSQDLTATRWRILRLTASGSLRGDSAHVAGLVIDAIIWLVWLVALGSEPTSLVHRYTVGLGGIPMPSHHSGQAPATQLPSSDNLGSAAAAFAPPASVPARDPLSAMEQGAAKPPVAALNGPAGTSGSADSPSSAAMHAKALYAYQANPEDPNEISFEKNEVFEVLDNKGKWWQVKKADGKLGIAPSNYLQLQQ